MMGLLERIFGDDRTRREPEFAGVQYAADADRLANDVDELLAAADPPPTGGELRGIVAPYGDYEYAGPVAAEAWKPVADRTSTFERAVVITSSARVPFRGIAVAGWDVWALPNGEVPVDVESVQRAVDRELARPIEAAFEPAAGLELQLPFLRRTLGELPWMPALVGDVGDDGVVEFLEDVWDETTLLVVSANLSEGFGVDEAERLDRETIVALESGDTEGIGRRQTSDRRPLRALARVAGARNLEVTTALRATSAETAGSSEQVVGYAAMHVTAP